ncbi:MAG: hypothetical protein QW785_02790 [Candidatus Anstonellales archaeon]
MNYEQLFQNELNRVLVDLSKVDLYKYRAYRQLRLEGFYPESGVSNIEIKELAIGKCPKIRPFDYTLKGDMIISLSREAYRIYNEYWLGTKGAYRKEEFSPYVIFDRYESNYILYKLGKIDQLGEDSEIFALFRDSGYIVKTGYKYGGIFRIYGLNYKRDSREHSKYIFNINRVLNSIELQRIVRVTEGVNKIPIFPYRKTNKRYREQFTMRKNDYYGIYVFGENSKIDLSMVVDSAILNRRKPLVTIVDREGDILRLDIELLKLRDKYFIAIYRNRS